MLTSMRRDFQRGITPSPHHRIPKGADVSIPTGGLIHRAAYLVTVNMAKARWAQWWEASRRGQRTFTPAAEACVVAMIAMRDAVDSDDGRRAVAARHPSPPCACCDGAGAEWVELHPAPAMRNRRPLLVPLCADHRAEFTADGFSRTRLQERLAFVAEVLGVA